MRSSHSYVAVVVASLSITLMAGLSSFAMLTHLVVTAAEHARAAPATPTTPSAPEGELESEERERALPRDVVGLWTLWPESTGDGDAVRFYFFHEKGIGLYRYGKIGLNTTNSYDWHVDDASGQLVLRFRKTGETVRTRFEVVAHGEGKPRTLVLVDDPKEPLAKTKSYTFVPPSQLAQVAPDFVDDAGAYDDGSDGKVPGRLWIDVKKFATGGSGFVMYQLRDAAIDGRGVGWHHIGDFDDWSTEALTFRYTGSTCKRDAKIEIDFAVRKEHAESLVVHQQKEGALTFIEDPRNFWHIKTYADGGPSFGSLWHNTLGAPQ